MHNNVADKGKRDKLNEILSLDRLLMIIMRVWLEKEEPSALI